MKLPAKTLIPALIMACMAAPVTAETEGDDDSVYSYGRWAVLSPAAGGGEPYVAALMPAAENLRPEESDDLEPEVVRFEVPTIPEPTDPPVGDDPRDRLPDDPRDRLPPRS